MADRPDIGNISYKPSVNIAQAPKTVGPMLFFVTGWVSLAWEAGLLAALRGDVARGAWGSPAVIGLVHGFTLGFLTMTMIGVLTQWVPVVFDVPPIPLSRIYWVWAVYTTGVILFVTGFLWPFPIALALGGILVATAITVMTVFVGGQLRRSKRPGDSMRGALAVSLASLNLAWILGLGMALAWVGWWPWPHFLTWHLVTVLVGWVGLTLLAVQMKLVPMFAMGKMDRVYPAVPVVLAVLGIGVGWTWPWTGTVGREWSAILWGASGLTAVIQVLWVVRTGKSPSRDPVFWGVFVGWLEWLLAAYWVTDHPVWSVFLMLWGAFTFIAAYQSRILPFIVALAIARKLPGPPAKAFFMAQSLNPRRSLSILAGASLLGALAILDGLRYHRAEGFFIAAGVLGMMLIAHIGQLALGIRRGRRERRAVVPKA